jgi:hypothetical protein
VGYALCEKVIRYGKVSGSVLLNNLNATYLADTLGILGEVEGFKFITEVNKLRESRILEVGLYGWGTNIMG